MIETRAARIALNLVIPAKAGIHGSTGLDKSDEPRRGEIDPRFRGDDGQEKAGHVAREIGAIDR
jgi:hypothetical protein